MTLGGDGIIFEVINGLFERPDWEMALEKTKLGIIPCGSGNGLAKAVSYAFKYVYIYRYLYITFTFQSHDASNYV